MNNQRRSSSRTLCTEESDTPQTNKRSPLGPLCTPGIHPLAPQSLYSSAGSCKARPRRRLQWAAVMGLKLCTLITSVCQRWIPAVTQPHPNPASHLSPAFSLFIRTDGASCFSETCLLFMILAR